MSKITAGQVHQALVYSIEKRWIPLSKGDSRVLACRLCTITDNNCRICPLALIGQQCVNRGGGNVCLGFRKDSAWGKYQSARTDEDKMKAANNMIAQLQKCLDTFFPSGLAKD